LRPQHLVSIPAGQASIVLPDNFGGIEGEVCVASTSSQSFTSIPVVGDGEVMEKYNRQPDATGTPQICAVRPIKDTQGNRGQRFTLAFWPAPASAIKLRLAYYVNPDCLSSDSLYHLGGVAHSETIREACLAAAEQFLDDSSSVHTSEFKVRLLASINMDRRLKPQKLGYNGNGSRYVDQRSAYGNGVRVNGLLY
jgi:hypothetical protein